MLTHARRAVPWAIVATSTTLMLTMLAVVGHSPWRMWPLQGIAVGLLAGACAWCLDDPSPEIADATARHLRWRAIAQGLGVAALLTAWTAGVLLLGGEMFGHTADVLAQGYAAAVAALGFTAWLRSRGPGHPGRLIAVVAVTAALGLALARPFPDTLAFFPYTPTGPWGTGRTSWAALALGGALALVDALGEGAWRRARRTTHQPTELSANQRGPYHLARSGGGRKA